MSGVTNVSFWWKVSSEAGFDFLEFYTNGVLARAISGEVDWEPQFFNLSATTNVLTWLYRKDDSYTAGSNCGWLDQVAFGGTLKNLPYTLQTPVRLPDGRIQLTVTGDVGRAVPGRVHDQPVEPDELEAAHQPDHPQRHHGHH